MVFEVAAAQIKPNKASYDKNLARVGTLFGELHLGSPRPNVIALPETALTGYFLEGGVRDVARSAQTVFEDLLSVYRANVPKDADVDVVVGFYELADGRYFNSAMYATLSGVASIVEPRICHVHHKYFLPTYGVFDEKRFVSRGRTIDAFDTRFGRSAMLVCEDVWHSVAPTIAALKGAQVIYVLSASPGREFTGDEVGNLSRWKRLLPNVADEHGVFVVYSGLVGFEGGKGFTGSSCVVDPWGVVRVEAPVTDECAVQAEIDLDDVAIARAASPMLADLEASLPDIVLELERVSRGPCRS